MNTRHPITFLFLKKSDNSFRFRLFSTSFSLVNLAAFAAAFAASSLSSQFGYAVLSKFSL